jgi:ABC-2 type transport system permease protein
MILALVIVYIYNFRVLNLRQIPLNQFNLEFLVTFLNLAMAAFVLAALGARFVFPAVSLEGQAFWILRTAPISLKKYLWNKFWIALPPITVLGIVLMGVTNFLLNIRWEFHLISFMAILPLSISLVALSTGMGAIYPQFKYENVAKVTTGFGGIIYMVFALAFILAIVALLSIGVLAHFQIIARGNVFQIPLIIGCIVLTLTLFGITIFIPMNMGIKNLETKEI